MKCVAGSEVLGSLPLHWAGVHDSCPVALAKWCMLSAWLASCREFQTPDEEMKKIVLKVVKQCVGTEGVEPDYIRSEVGDGWNGWGFR